MSAPHWETPSSTGVQHASRLTRREAGGALGREGGAVRGALDQGARDLAGRLRIVLEWGFFGSLAVTVGLNGGEWRIGADVSLALFSLILLGVAFLPIRRGALRRLQWVGLAMVAGCIAWAWVQTFGLADTRWANPVWDHLGQQFGERGSMVAVVRYQPLWELPGLVTPFLAFIAALALFRDRRALTRLAFALVTIGVTFAVYGMAQQLLFPEWHFGVRYIVDSLTGFYVYRNAAAALLLITLCANLYIVEGLIKTVRLRDLIADVIAKRRIRRSHLPVIILIGCALLQFVAIAFTKSRAVSVLSLVVVVIAVSWLIRSSGGRLSLSKVKIAAIVGGVVVLVFLGIGEGVLNRFDTQGFDDARWCLYPSLWRMVMDNMPFGVGFGGFTPAFPSYRDPVCGVTAVWERAHNSYIQGLATAGVAFPILFVLFAYSVSGPLFRMARKVEREGFAARVVLLLALEMALHSVVDFPLEIPGNAVVYLSFMGAVLAVGPGQGQGEPTRRRVRSSRHRSERRRSSRDGEGRRASAPQGEVAARGRGEAPQGEGP